MKMDFKKFKYLPLTISLVMGIVFALGPSREVRMGFWDEFYQDFGFELNWFTWYLLSVITVYIMFTVFRILRGIYILLEYLMFKIEDL